MKNEVIPNSARRTVGSSTSEEVSAFPHANPNLVLLTCENCKSRFFEKRKGSKFCSPSCRLKFWRGQKPSTRIKPAPKEKPKHQVVVETPKPILSVNRETKPKVKPHWEPIFD